MAKKIPQILMLVFIQGMKPLLVSISRVCILTHLEPQKDHRQGHHRTVTTCPLLVTGRHPAKPLQAVDQPFDLIALPIKLAVKRSGSMLVLLPRNGGSDTSPVQVTAIFAEGVSFIRRQALWAQTQLATHRRIAPCSISYSATVISCCWPELGEK